MSETKPRILVADDNATNRRLLTAIFQAEGLEVVVVENGEAAVHEVEASAPTVAVLDLEMPKLDGVQTLERLQQLAPDMPVVILTAHGDIPTAVAAIKRGAYDFLTRPIHNDQLVVVVRRALERAALLTEVRSLRRRLAGSGVPLLGRSAVMQDVQRRIDQVAESNLTVLIHGETGTGKELVARAIHQRSSRATGPFVALDCGAIPDSLLESELFGYEKGAFSGADRKRDGYLTLAQKGTLFLDEIANLSLPTQAKLLRAVQEREARPLGASKPVPIDVRFVAATHEVLRNAAEDRFRKDLYFRLAEFVITLPPLRERREDIRELATRFLEDASVEMKRAVGGMTDEALARLEAHSWPGNVRELRNVIRQAVVRSTGPEIGASDLADLLETGKMSTSVPATIAIAPGTPLREIAEAAAAEAERQAIRAALRTTRGNKSQAARLLSVDYKTLHLKVKRYGLTTRTEDGDSTDEPPP